jgi:large subunit ribosomal protein L30
MLKVTQVRSAIGTKPKHRGTLRALGLRGLGQSNVLPDRPEIRGMIARVPHLIKVETVDTGPAGGGAAKAHEQSGTEVSS